jgi:hypothetical protein
MTVDCSAHSLFVLAVIIRGASRDAREKWQIKVAAGKGLPHFKAGICFLTLRPAFRTLRG